MHTTRGVPSEALFSVQFRVLRRFGCWAAVPTVQSSPLEELGPAFPSQGLCTQRPDLKLDLALRQRVILKNAVTHLSSKYNGNPYERFYAPCS